MPFVSKAQQRWAHTKEGIKALGGKDKVQEWDVATIGKKLPDHIKKEIKRKLRAGGHVK